MIGLVMWGEYVLPLVYRASSGSVPARVGRGGGGGAPVAKLAASYVLTAALVPPWRGELLVD